MLERKKKEEKNSTGCCFSLGSSVVLGGHLRRAAGGCARGLFRGRTAESFRDLAQSKGHDLVLEIAPDLTYKGDEYAIRQLVSILLDNAVKYARAGSAITLTLEKTRRGITLRCRNGSDPIPEDTLAKLFDRFYRADPSRSAATGGFGIGLSIARGIAEAHRGSICARMAGEEVEFAAELR